LLFLINSIEVIAVHPKTIPNTILWVTGIDHSRMAEPIIAAAKKPKISNTSMIATTDISPKSPTLFSLMFIICSVKNFKCSGDVYCWLLFVLTTGQLFTLRR
jgi:hypothetical protein